jgi:hypothetical protein
MNHPVTAEEKLVDALLEIHRLKEQLAAVNGQKKAVLPWQDPDTVKGQRLMKYNLAIKPELYLKVKWLLEHKGGLKSMQVFFERAANKLADEYVAELSAK